MGWRLGSAVLGNRIRVAEVVPHIVCDAVALIRYAWLILGGIDRPRQCRGSGVHSVPLSSVGILCSEENEVKHWFRR